MIWPMQEMARSFTSWSMSAAFSRLMVHVNRSLMYGEGSKASEASDWLSRGRITWRGRGEVTRVRLALRSAGAQEKVKQRSLTLTSCCVTSSASEVIL